MTFQTLATILAAIILSSARLLADEVPGPPVMAGMHCAADGVTEVALWNSSETPTTITRHEQELVSFSWRYLELAEGGLVEMDCDGNVVNIYVRGLGEISTMLIVPAGIDITERYKK